MLLQYYDHDIIIIHVSPLNKPQVSNRKKEDMKLSNFRNFQQILEQRI